MGPLWFEVVLDGENVDVEEPLVFGRSIYFLVSLLWFEVVFDSKSVGVWELLIFGRS